MWVGESIITGTEQSPFVRIVQRQEKRSIQLCPSILSAVVPEKSSFQVTISIPALESARTDASSPILRGTIPTCLGTAQNSGSVLSMLTENRSTLRESLVDLKSPSISLNGRLITGSTSSPTALAGGTYTARIMDARKQSARWKPSLVVPSGSSDSPITVSHRPGRSFAFTQ